MDKKEEKLLQQEALRLTKSIDFLQGEIDSKLRQLKEVVNKLTKE